MDKNYIGIASSFHDSALSIVDSNGKVIFAEATERYMQNKRAMNIPADVIVRIVEIIEEYCDPNAQLVVSRSWSSEACGFGQLTGEEWKIMGLASYGKFDQEIYTLLKSIIKVNGLGFEWQINDFINFFSDLEGFR